VDLSQCVLEALRKDEEFVLYRGEYSNQPGSPSMLLLAPASLQPGLETLRKIEHEYSLRDELDSAWAVRSLALSEQRGQTMLVLEDPGGETLDQLLPGPIEITRFLRLAVSLATSLNGLHKSELIHKDVKPANILVDAATGQARLMGFGIASRLARERQTLEPPEFIAGTLAYMAPEQTGRMNRSIDSRSDLYALGVTLYEMLTGTLPFMASDPMELVHCHIARQPTPPCVKLKGVPDPVSAIIMKLLAKTAEERYQTASGAASDLRHCLAEWETQHRIDEFPLGEQDTPDRLAIPEKLYGRESEIGALLASFDRVVADGRPELVLVSGYSGAGKSSVVNELHKALVPPRGLFASGKFDQYKRDIPYSTLAQAFQTLTRGLLAKDEVDLTAWREALCEALGPNGRLMIDLVPELKLIIGEQPPVPELPAQDAQRRFQLVLRRFMGVFAQPEHPFALFLDDLQWLDAATLEVLEDLLTQADVQHLLMVGAYRDNEVDAAHALARKLETIRKAGARVNEIRLAPLSRQDVAHLITDTLQCEADSVLPLVQLVYGKTAGNPFFTIQFISALEHERLLAFDHSHRRWSWDVDRIHARGYTDNVVDLMITKLTRLPARTRDALCQLACLGNAARATTLCLLYGTDEAQVRSDLFEATRTGMVERQGGWYRFVHDRVQEAAYSLIPERMRPEAHLRIGRLLLAHIPPGEREEAMFEIANQLNRGSPLVTSAEERLQIAELNLIAGRRARASTAYKSALAHLAAGEALLSEEQWERHYRLRFSLALNRAECEFVTGDFCGADERLSRLQPRAIGSTDLAAVACLRIALYTTDHPDRAIEVGVEQLRTFGIEWSTHPTEEEVRAEYDFLRERIGDRPIESLADLPSTKDPNLLALMEVLLAILPPAAFFTERKLHALAVLRIANLSLEHGYCDGSPLAFAQLSMAIGPRFGHYRDGFRFGHLGVALVEREELSRFRGKVYCVVGYHVLPWTQPIQAAVSMMQRALDLAQETGDLLFAAFCQWGLISLGLASGARLDELEVEAERYLQSTCRLRFSLVIDTIATQLALIRTLRGLTPEFGDLDDVHVDAPRMEHRFSGNPMPAIATCWHWIRKMQASYLAGDYAAAVVAASKAQPLLGISHSDTVEFWFYGALSHAASWDSAPPEEKQLHVEALKAHYDQLDTWAKNFSQNFENRAALVAAEIARIEGRDLDAMRLYQQAIRSAGASGFIHHEAISYEVAARFYAGRSFDKIADTYFLEARYGYLRWGAEGKVHQLDQEYPRLRHDKPVASSTSIIGAPVEHLDLATVIKVSQAVSGEMVLEKLIDSLMRVAIEHAGAERGLLIVSRGDELQMEAEATIGGEDVTVHLRDGTRTPAALPESIVRYVMRTQETVMLDDASSQNPFSADPYIVQRRARSILSLPLINRGTLIGILYLENNLTQRVFTPDRVTVLKVLASQAAISLQNTWLYRDLADREAKIRRLVDANILGIFIWNPEGAIVGANEAFLRMLQYDRQDLVSGRVRWTDLTPGERRERDEHALAELNATGTVQPYEKEYFRKDGSRVPVLIGGALFQEGGNEGVAFVLDLSEQKRAEEALRSSEAYLAEAQRLSQTGSWAWSPDQDIRYWSEECYRVLSFDPQDGLPRFGQFFQRIHPDDQFGFRKLVRTAIREKAEWEADYRIVHPGGAVRDIHIVGHPVLSTSGHLVEFVGTVIDVTERKRAEEELRRSEMELRQMLDLAPQQVAVFGPGRERLYANRILLDYLGLTLEEWRQRFDYERGDYGLPRGEFIHPDDWEPVTRHFDRALTSGAGFELELRLRNGDGRYRWFLVRYNPVRDDHRHITRWFSTATDIDDRKRAEERLQQENVALREEVDKASMFEEIVGTSPALQPGLARVGKVARSDTTVLIMGETGTGKELVARAIHRRSARCARPFVSVNCAAVPRELIASELFGHEKGAFTGATQRRLGRFELAHGGTIFLDEVGELPIETQVALLRVLQEREFERVGGSAAIRVDVRVIAATNRDLLAAIEAGTFRSDLFYRLNVFPITVPPLRERADDIPLLVEYFIDRYARKAGKSIRRVNKRTLDRLQSYPWPGNVRELQNVIERSVIVCDTDEFTVDDSWLSAGPAVASRLALSSSVAGHEKTIIEDALRASGGRVFGPSGAAARLGIARSTLESKIRALGIDKNRFRARPAKQ
jgi:PAS domain S-box-containing protein